MAVLNLFAKLNLCLKTAVCYAVVLLLTTSQNFGRLILQNLSETACRVMLAYLENVEPKHKQKMSLLL